MIGIYMFTNNKNGMSYIGQSTNIDRRYQEHKTRKKEEQTFFHDAIQKFGFDNFSFQILEECSVADLNEREKYYIKKYQTRYPNGYNLTSGGNEPHANKLLYPEEAHKIIALLRDTALTNFEIGAMFNVSDQMVSNINCGRAWCSEKYTYPIRPRRCISRNEATIGDNGIKTTVPKEKPHCKHCGKVIDEVGATNLCVECYKLKRKEESIASKISKEALFELLHHCSFLEVGRRLGVSDNAVRKLCDAYQIPRHASFYKRNQQNIIAAAG